MELKESKRVVSTIMERLTEVIAKEYPLAVKMLPAPVKQTISDAIEGAYASGYNHGYCEHKELAKKVNKK